MGKVARRGWRGGWGGVEQPPVPAALQVCGGERTGFSGSRQLGWRGRALPWGLGPPLPTGAVWVTVIPTKHPTPFRQDFVLR